MPTKQQNIDEARWRMLMQHSGLAQVKVMLGGQELPLVEVGELTRLACKFKREKD